MKKLAIIGAGKFHDPLIQKAKELGFETHVFAWRTGDPGEYSADYFYPISITNQDCILKECQRIKPMAVVSCASDLATCTVGHIAAQMGLPANSKQAIERTTNKIIMRNVLRQAGLPQPTYFEADDALPSDYETALAFPVVVKPSDRSGSRGVVKANSVRDMLRAIAEARDLSFERKAIVEQYIPGRYYSAEAISYNGSHTVLALTRNDTVLIGNSFYDRGHMQPCGLNAELQRKLTQLTVSALDALGITMGASHTEFVLGEDGLPYIIEVSGSMAGDFIGSDLVLLSSGNDYLKMIIDTACGKKPVLEYSNSRKDAEIHYISCKREFEAYARLKNEQPEVIGRKEEPVDPEQLPETEGQTKAGFYILARKPKEMGGYLPLELDEGMEYFTNVPKDYIHRLNTGRTAVWAAVQELSVKRVFVPYLCNAAVSRAVEDAGAEVVYYYVDENCLPVDVRCEEDEAVVILNYCGLFDSAVAAYAQRGQRLIIDNAGAFFCPPILREDVYNIYSCRKFFGVADGAYLIGPRRCELPLEQDYSAGRASFLLQSIELGTNGAYQMCMDNEQSMAGRYCAMSDLTLRMLKSVNYEKVKTTRRNNYNCLHGYLGASNGLHMELGDCVPQYYPFLASAALREYLLTRHIYLPLMWRKCLSEEFAGRVEQRYARDICCLPIDQRYGEADMAYLAKAVLAAL